MFVVFALKEKKEEWLLLIPLVLWSKMTGNITGSNMRERKREIEKRCIIQK